MNKLDLIDRTAVVTGGAKGIGLAIANRFIHSGANVIIWDIDKNRLRQSVELLDNKESVKTEVVDVTAKQSIEAATSKVLEAENKIDILVNNAGAVGTLAPVWEQPIENWEKMLRLNLTSAFMCCQSIVPSMISKKYGRVVNIASNAGKIGIKNNSGYAAAKAGLISLTKSLSKEVAKTGVLVNCITPGGANTELYDNLSGEYRSRIEAGMELGRLVEPEEIAALAAWLASEECSFSTGAAFDISGGRADY